MWESILPHPVYATVKTGKHLSSEFKVNKGLRQRDAIAPLLLNVVLEAAIRGSNVDTRETMFDKCSQIMVYVAITGRRLQGIKDVFTLLLQQTNKTGLEISEKDKIYYSIAKALQ